jgi:hypothetical protein
MANQITFDSTKTDLGIILNFNGVMKLGYAVGLTSDGITWIWKTKGQNSTDQTLDIVKINIPQPLNTLDGMFLSFQFVFQGLDPALVNYSINVSFSQEGSQIGNAFILPIDGGKLTGDKQNTSLTVKLIKK